MASASLEATAIAPAKEGWLQKQSGGKSAWTTGGVANRWQKRWFRLYMDSSVSLPAPALHWFDKPADVTPKNFMTCDDVTIRRDDDTCFTLKNHGRELRLKAVARDPHLAVQEVDSWIQAIELVNTQASRTQKLKDSAARLERRKLVLPQLEQTVRSLQSALDEAKQAQAAFHSDEDDIKHVNAIVADHLRIARRAAASGMSSAVRALEHLVEPGKPTSRAGYLRSLPQLIPPPPAGCSWESEWPSALLETAHHNGWLMENMDEQWVESQSGMSVTEMRHKSQKIISHLVSRGLPQSQAEAFALLYAVEPAIARALREGDPCYASFTYAITEAMSKLAQLQTHVAPKLYAPMRGSMSLSVTEPLWETLFVADHTGFRGFTCHGAVLAFSNTRAFGFQWKLLGPSRPTAGHEIENAALAAALLGSVDLKLTKAQRQELNITSLHEADFIKAGENYYQPTDLAESLFLDGGFTMNGSAGEIRNSPVVCFESRKADESGLHTAVMKGQAGYFPPNTLFRLISIQDSFTIRGVTVRQPLYTVSATYLPPLASLENSALASKLCGSLITLSYGDRTAYTAGLEDILARPVLTLEQEFSRDVTFTDFEGETHTLKDQWSYVNGPASRAGMTHGARDVNNHGKLPEDFVQQVNSYLRSRRASAGGSLPEAHAYLTLEEVLAVRLYSGPCYQPINNFLRQVATLRGEIRTELAHHPGLTYSAVVRHLCFAIRKLAAACTDQEASRPLWRGVRGTLPKSFWVPDDQDMVCATDTAFMSTSLTRETPISFMRQGENVLWELLPMKESDSAFHRGADISMLSQYENERECLFPPCTMLVAQRRVDPFDGAARASDSLKEQDNVSQKQNLRKPWQTEDGVGDAEGKVKFVAIKVMPSFI